MRKLSSWQKKLLFPLVGIIVLFIAARGYYRLTDDVRLANMMHEMPHNKEWEIPSLSPMDQQRVNTILDQPFYYIGKGAQSYAFASEDGQYVLKFFKFKHLKPSWFVEMLPSISFVGDYKKTQKERKQRRLEGVFEGYRLAYAIHKEPSGLLFIHLNTSDNLHKKVVLKDKIGLSHVADLDQLVFVLQEKAKITRSIIKESLDSGDTAAADAAIGEIFALYLSEYKKGIYDRDHGVMHNTGFVGSKPIHLDVGKLTDAPEMKKPEVSHPDLEKIAYKFHAWIHTNYPQYAKEIDRAMEARLELIFAHPWSFNNDA